MQRGLAVALVVVLVVVSVMVVSRTRHKPAGPQGQVVAAFVRALGAQQWNDAYDVLSTSSRSGTTPDAIANWRMDKIVSGIIGSSFTTSNADRQDVIVKIDADDGSRIALPLVVLIESGRWCIELPPAFWNVQPSI